MDAQYQKETKEKQFVALTSVLAAFLLTGAKIIVGFETGSIGILSEALHSSLDLFAALLTFFAVKIADKPADSQHHYGHGKVENLSALLQAILLIITCIWIFYEALHRLITGETEIIVSFWSFFVIILSIVVDISRSRALKKAAKKYNSQALEADALHFTTDIFSSSVVLLGLIGAMFSFYFLDSIAALIVAFVVLLVSFKLGKRAVDALIDKSPKNIAEKIIEISKDIPEITNVHDLKVRTAGAYFLVELNIHIDNQLTLEEAHKISHRYEKRILQEIKRCKVHVHIEPENE